jgi:HAD superfamily hydrolase (TIGR01450 family)
MSSSALILPARRARLIIFDLHGVLVHRPARVGRELSAAEVVAALRDLGVMIRFVTNASSKGPEEIVALLDRFGIPAKTDEVATAGQALAAYLREWHPGSRVLVIGQIGLRQLIADACRDRITIDDAGEANVVVVGRDPGLSEAKLTAAARAARRGAVLLASSVEATVPAAGCCEPGPGHTVSAVEDAMGRRAHVVGKPNPFILEQVLGLGRDVLRDALIVGDTAETDIRLGTAVGAITALYPRPAALVPESAPAADWILDRLEQILLFTGGRDGDDLARAEGICNFQQPDPCDPAPRTVDAILERGLPISTTRRLLPDDLPEHGGCLLDQSHHG